MATQGKLEGLCTIPTGNVTFTVTETGGSSPGAHVITLTAGNSYYHSNAGNNVVTLPARLKALLDAAGGGTYTVSVDAGEGGTGRYTISATGITSMTIAWTSTSIRDWLGFEDSDTSTAGTTFTSTNQAQGLWIAGFGYQSLNGDKAGWRESNQQIAETAGGHVYSVMGRQKVINEITWPMESRAKTWRANESRTNESFESFILTSVWGTENVFGQSAGPVRWHPDADSATSHQYKCVGLLNWQPSQVREQFLGLWTIQTGRLVEVPS